MANGLDMDRLNQALQSGQMDQSTYDQYINYPTNQGGPEVGGDGWQDLNGGQAQDVSNGGNAITNSGAWTGSSDYNWFDKGLGHISAGSLGDPNQGILGSLLGRTGADAAKEAAAQQQAAAQRAVGVNTGMYNQGMHQLQPYQQAGVDSTRGLMQGMQNGQFQTDPSQFQTGQYNPGQGYQNQQYQQGPQFQGQNYQAQQVGQGPQFNQFQQGQAQGYNPVQRGQGPQFERADAGNFNFDYKQSDSSKAQMAAAMEAIGGQHSAQGSRFGAGRSKDAMDYATGNIAQDYAAQENRARGQFEADRGFGAQQAGAANQFGQNAYQFGTGSDINQRQFGAQMGQGNFQFGQSMGNQNNMMAQNMNNQNYWQQQGMNTQDRQFGAGLNQGDMQYGFGQGQQDRQYGYNMGQQDRQYGFGQGQQNNQFGANYNMGANNQNYGMYNQQAQNQFQNYFNMSNQGAQTAGTMGQLGQGYAGNITNALTGGANAGAAGQVGAANNQSQGAMNLANLGIGAIAAFSDRRLKKNIKKIGEKKGFNEYLFQYLWSNEWFTGFMADEVKKLRPDAITKIGEFDAINYGVL